MDSLIILASNPGEGLSGSIVIKKDTTINNYKYNQIGFVGSRSHMTINLDTDFSYLREDSTHSKLYIYSNEKNLEYLIMDLNLNPKDTFQIGEDKKFVVDSIFYNDDYKIVEFENYDVFGRLNVTSNIKLQFIEGIGPNWGFFYPFNYYGLASLLLCSYKDNIVTYENPYDFECFAFWRVTNIDELNDYEEIKIFDDLPNKIIEIDTEKLFDLYVYDITGNQILKQKDIYRNTCIQMAGHDILIAKIVMDKEVYTRKIINKNYW